MESDWHKVKINCTRATVPDPPTRPIRFRIGPEITELRVRKLLQSHFPDGPEAARRACRSDAAWRKTNAMAFFQNKTERPEPASRWETFLSAWRSMHIAAEDREILHAHVADNAFDFRALDHSASRKRDDDRER